MRKILWIVVTLSILAMPALTIAKEAKWEKIDVKQDDYKLYSFRLANAYGGSGWFVYIVDPQACICTQKTELGGSVLVDCKNLSVYSELKPYVEKCK